jgi:hypothetical protein
MQSGSREGLEDISVRDFSPFRMPGALLDAAPILPGRHRATEE